MAIQKIITVPDPILRQKSKPVNKIDKKIKKLARTMAEILKKGPEGKPIGVGLSAVQIGKPIRLFVAYSKKSRKYLTFINPEIIWRSKRLTSGVPERENKFEGCLSAPGIFGLVRRSKAVKIRYLAPSGQIVIRKFDGLTGTVIQHEYDHLGGVLFTEQVLKQKGKLYKLEKDKEGKEVFVEVELIQI